MDPRKLTVETLQEIGLVMVHKKSQTISFWKSWRTFGNNELRVGMCDDDKLPSMCHCGIMFLMLFLEKIMEREFIMKEDENNIYFYREDYYNEMIVVKIAVSADFQNHEMN